MITLKNRQAQAVIVLILVWLGVFIASYAQNQLAGMSVQFMEHYGFTSEQYAAIYSASQFIGIFFAFVSGVLSDKIGTRNIVLIAAAMVLIATVARIFAFSFEAQYISNMFCGFTGMFMAVNRAKILGGWFPPATIALAVGIATTTTPVANTLGVGLTSLMPSIEFAFIVTAVVSAVFFVGWFLFGKERSDEIAAAEEAAKDGESGKVLKNLVEIIKTPWIWVLCGAAFFLMAAQVPLMAFTNASLINARGLDPVAAGGFATAITIGMGIGSVVTPIIVRFVKAYRPVVAIYAVLTAVGIYLGWQMPIGVVMYVVYFVTGWCLGALLAMVFTWARHDLRPREGGNGRRPGADVRSGWRLARADEHHHPLGGRRGELRHAVHHCGGVHGGWRRAHVRRARPGQEDRRQEGRLRRRGACGRSIGTGGRRGAGACLGAPPPKPPCRAFGDPLPFRKQRFPSMRAWLGPVRPAGAFAGRAGRGSGRPETARPDGGGLKPGKGKRRAEQGWLPAAGPSQAAKGKKERKDHVF